MTPPENSGIHRGSCPFCGPAAPEPFLTSPHGLAIHDAFPVSEGHTLVIPRQHVSSIYDLDSDVQRDLWDLVSRVRHQLLEDYHPQGFTIGMNDGEAAGQTVDHAHIHVIPRVRGDVADPRGGIRCVVPHRTVYWRE